MTKRMRIGAVALLAPLLLTACSSGGEPVSDDPLSSENSAVTTGTSSLDTDTGSTETTKETPSDPSGTTKTDGSKASTANTTKAPTKRPAGTSASATGSKTNSVSTQPTSNTQSGGYIVKYDNDFFTYRNGLQNTYAKLTKQKKLTVAYMGGSVTWGTGVDDLSKSYREQTMKWLRNQFPDATINEVNASVPSACSAFGAYCVDQDVIAQKPDLVFIEYAINDAYASGSYGANDVSIQYETIIRKILTANPACDIVALYTTDAGLSMDPPLYLQADIQDEIAAHYGVPSINIGWQLRKQNKLTQPKASDGSLTKQWLKYFTDIVHPTAAGYAGYATIIESCLNVMFTEASQVQNLTVTNRRLPSAKNEKLLMNTSLVKTSTISLDGSKNWEKTNQVFGAFPQYTGYVIATAADNELVYTFTGTSIAVFGQNFGSSSEITYSIDGGEKRTVTYKDHPTPLERELSAGKHTVRIQVPAGGQMAGFMIE